MVIKLETASELIIERARQLVTELIAKRGHDNPPFLSEEYASLVGVQSIEKTDLGKAGKSGGVLLRFDSGSKIKLNINDPLVRQNFSCAHEIGHLLYSALKLEQYINTIEHRTFNPQVVQRKRSKVVEKLCDEAATELLMPTSVFSKYLDELGTSIQSIERLADLFKVSIQSAAIRVSETSQKPCYVSKWTPRKNQPNSLQLSWPKKKKIGNTLFSPLNKNVNPPSILHDAYNFNTLLKGDLQYKFGKGKKRFPSEIKGFGYGVNRYIVSLSFLDG